jgi:hypothetical protein
MSDDASAPAARTAAPAEGPLAWEAANAKRAGLCALAAGATTIAGSVITGLANSDTPQADDRILTLVDTLARTAEGQTIPPGQFSTLYAARGDQAPLFILGAVLIGLGALLIFPALAYVYRAARARGPVPKLAIITLAAGSAGFAIGQTVSRTAFYLGAASFADASDRTNSAAFDAQNTPTVVTGAIIGELGALLLGVAFVIVCLHAMRVGLLTRFMGIVGIFVGATIVIRPLDPVGVVRSFWLAALGLMILGRLPRGRPPAWTVPEAVPWPSQQQVREQRMAEQKARQGARPDRAARRRGAPEGEPDADGDGGAPEAPQARVPAPRAPQPRRDDATPGGPQAGARKRKRKRR